MDIHYRPQTIRTTKHYEGKRISLRADVVDCEGAEVIREVVEHPGAVAILPIYEDGSVSLIRQYRHPLDEVILEVPAGTLEEGEDPEFCAKRELAEEAFLGATTWHALGDIVTTPGFSSEKIYLFAAMGLSESVGSRDVGEFMEIHRFSAVELWEMIEDGRVRDAKSIACVTRAFRKGLVAA